ncbi:hydrogenase formation protein HypD, partial [Candidatus Bathyarchaeota archaeon]
VTWDGNVKAQKLISRVFDVVGGRWRGLGVIPGYILSLKKVYEHLDA